MEGKVKTKKRNMLKKTDIGTPMDFRHIQHVGNGPMKTRDLDIDFSATSQSETDNPFEESDDMSSEDEKHPLVCTCPPEYSPYHTNRKKSEGRQMMSTPTIPEHRDNPLDDCQQYTPPTKPLPPKPLSASNLALNLIPSMNIFKSSKGSNSKSKGAVPPSKIPRTKTSLSRTSSTASNSFPSPAASDQLPPPPPQTVAVQRRIKSPASLFRRRSFSMHGGTLDELPPLQTNGSYRSSVQLSNAPPIGLATLGRSTTFVRQRRPLPAIPPPTVPNKSENNNRILSRGFSFSMLKPDRKSLMRPLPPTPPSTPHCMGSNTSFNLPSPGRNAPTLPKLQMPLVPISKVSPLTPSIWPLAPIPFVPLPQINDHGSTTGFVSFDRNGQRMDDGDDYSELPPPPPDPEEIRRRMNSKGQSRKEESPPVPMDIICLRHSPSRSILSSTLPEPPPDPFGNLDQDYETVDELPPPPPIPTPVVDLMDIYSTVKPRNAGDNDSVYSNKSGHLDDFNIQETQLEKITKIMSDKIFYSQWPSIMDQLFSQTNLRHFGESSCPNKLYTDIVKKTLELWLMLNPDNSTFESLLQAVEDGRHKLAADTLKESRNKIFRQ